MHLSQQPGSAPIGKRLFARIVNNPKCDVKPGNSEQFLLESAGKLKLDLTFLDPPFNQGKQYDSHDDSMPANEYWNWMTRICKLTFENTNPGGAIYFMHREKNTEHVLKSLRESGWTFQNLIIWKKKTSAVPNIRRFGLHYQIIAFATKGNRPKAFHKLRIDPPMLVNEKIRRPTGMYATDVWDDIRELTSGYYAGDEPLRGRDGRRIHKQQSPVRLLVRIILSSTNVGDMVFDPFAGTGTTLVVAKQLDRDSLGIELDPKYFSLIKDRIEHLRQSDYIGRHRKEYRHTNRLNHIWHVEQQGNQPTQVLPSGEKTHK